MTTLLSREPPGRSPLDEPGPATGAVDPAPPVRFAHIRALDGLRGLAVVLVVLSHFTPGLAPGGFLGVDLFFVLSGFLITSLLVAERESSGRISLRNFWLRRARRLFPAMLTVVAVSLLVTWLTAEPDKVHRVGADGLSTLFYVANWRFVLSGQSYIRQFLDGVPSPLNHTWSLAIEEQFYIVWPLVVLGVGALCRRAGVGGRVSFRRWLAGSCGLAAVGSFGLLAYRYHHGADLDRLYYGTDTRVFIILVGAALGAATAGRPMLARSATAARVVLIGAGGAGTLALVVATRQVSTEQTWLYAGGFGLVALTMVVVLAAAAQDGPNPLARFFEVRPLVGLGLISYGVYLWHWPINVWVRADNTGLDGPALFLLRCGLTLAVSLVSYRFVEQPIRHGRLPRLGRAGPGFTSAMVVGGVVVSLAVPILVYPGVAAVPTGEPVDAAEVSVTPEYDTAPRCDADAPPEWVHEGEPLRVALEGNSIAGEMIPCLERTFSVRNITLVPHTRNYLECRELPRIEEELADPATRPDAALVFTFSASKSECGEPWFAPFDEMVRLYRAAGVPVFLAPGVPTPPDARNTFANRTDAEYEHYSLLAAEAPGEVFFVDAGRFLRDDGGQYRWRMPCRAADEPGCDAAGTVGVRFTDGVHFCSDPVWPKGGCAEERFQAGEKRAAAALAAGVIPALRDR